MFIPVELQKMTCKRVQMHVTQILIVQDFSEQNRIINMSVY